MRIKWIIFFISSILLFSCLTTEEVTIKSLDENSIIKLHEIELNLIEYEFTKDIQQGQKIRSDLQALYKNAENNKLYLAKLCGLEGYLNYIDNNIINVNKFINYIEGFNKNEKYYYILNALIEKDNNKIEKGLLEAINQDKISSIAYLQLAFYYFQNNKFDSALNYFNESLIRANDKISNFIKKYENLCIILAGSNEDIVLSDKSILQKEKLTVNDMLLIINENKMINDSKIIPLKRFYDYLIQNDFIYNKENYALNDSIKRKDIAFIVYKILMHQKIGLKTVYDYDFCPIQDINLTNYYYMAVLTNVQFEFMDLIDGEKFYPNDTLTPIEFYKIIAKIKKVFLSISQ